MFTDASRTISHARRTIVRIPRMKPAMPLQPLKEASTPTRIGELVAEVLPREEEVDEEEHGSDEHQLRAAPEGVESFHTAPSFRDRLPAV